MVVGYGCCRRNHIVLMMNPNMDLKRRLSHFNTVVSPTTSVIMGFIHINNVCQKEVITFSRLWEEEEARLIIREENMGPTKYQALTIQRKSLKRWGIWRNKFLKNLLYILSIWIRNDDVMNEEDDEVERRSLATKQIKISIQLSFHDIVLLYTFYIQLMCYAWSNVCINDSILLIWMWWVSSSWCSTTLHFYLSRMKPLCWHIGLVHNLNDVLVEMEGI